MPTRQEPQAPLIIAHRPRDAAGRENCPTAVAAALQAGADVIEIDVRPSSDGVLFALHGDDLANVAESGGRASRLSAVRLGDVLLRRTGSAVPAAPDERVATLDACLAAVADRGGVYLDCRQCTAMQIAEALAPWPAVAPLLVCSDSPEPLKRANTLRADVRTVVTWRPTASTLETLPSWATDVEVFADVLTEALTHALRNAGRRVGALALGRRDTPENWGRMAAWGVDWIMTDHPAEVRRQLP